MKQQWRAVWRGKDILVKAGTQEIDRIPGEAIRRVIFVERGHAQSASDHAFAIVELDDDYVLFPADAGLAGLVHFERQSFWGLHPCVYWTDVRRASLPPQYCQPAHWFLRRGAPVFCRVNKATLQDLVNSWALEGPQTWEQRRWSRIAQQSGLGGIDPVAPAAALARQQA